MDIEIKASKEVVDLYGPYIYSQAHISPPLRAAYRSAIITAINNGEEMTPEHVEEIKHRVREAFGESV